MRDRAGDRRGYARFEIVGTLGASVETWRRFVVRNLSARGVLIATPHQYSLGVGLRGRLKVHGREREVQGEVRRVEASLTPDDGYDVGVAFLGQEIPMNELLELPVSGPVGVRSAPDRRQSDRVEYSGDAELAVPAWTTVTLKDLSAGGTMFASSAPIGVGTAGSLRTRLGDLGFSAEIGVRRVDRYRDGYGVAAAFISMDEESRRNLAAFLTTSGPDDRTGAKDSK